MALLSVAGFRLHCTADPVSLQTITACLHSPPDPLVTCRRGITSKRSPVTTLGTLAGKALQTEDVRDAVIQEFLNRYPPGRAGPAIRTESPINIPEVVKQVDTLRVWCSSISLPSSVSITYA